jgi:hypothetical protein
MEIDEAKWPILDAALGQLGVELESSASQDGRLMLS